MQESVYSIVETYRKRFNVRGRYFSHSPAKDLCLIIVIPSYKEPCITDTLLSLCGCLPPSGSVEIIITINAPEDASEEVLSVNIETLKQIKEWEKGKPEFISTLVIQEEAIPKKQAGAGFARKIGMDEAAQRWAMLNRDGPIICLDADCTVSKNYLVEAEKAFANPSTKVGHFHFEHNYQQETNADLGEGILYYELHLRCYIQGLKNAGFPFAIHTVGSCMAVRTSAYAKAGGMNQRKAGEDFYFMHKLAPLGGWKSIAEATVHPSCRASDRVPFGTGRFQLEWQKKTNFGLTYHSEIYQLMKPVFEWLPQWYDKEVNLNRFTPAVKEFLTHQNIFEEINQMKKHASSAETFAKRCWQWMDGFMVLKLVHHLRDHGFPNQPVLDVAKLLLLQAGNAPSKNLKVVLNQFRELDRYASCTP